MFLCIAFLDYGPFTPPYHLIWLSCGLDATVSLLLSCIGLSPMDMISMSDFVKSWELCVWPSYAQSHKGLNSSCVSDEWSPSGPVLSLTRLHLSGAHCWHACEGDERRYAVT